MLFSCLSISSLFVNLILNVSSLFRKTLQIVDCNFSLIYILASFTNITVSACSSSTCIGTETPYRTSIVTVLYPFDGNTNDLSGYATGVALGSSTPSFSSEGYVNEAIRLIASSQQYVQIPSIDLTNRSFTIQAWLYTTTLSSSSDYGIFCQCDVNSICLALNLRNARFTLSFDSMNANNNTLIGSSIVTSSNWVHVSVVYDATLFQQQIYVDGKIDALSNGIVSAYQGVSSVSTTATIGRSQSFSHGTTYFDR